jgi:hypothetical protein
MSKTEIYKFIFAALIDIDRNKMTNFKIICSKYTYQFFFSEIPGHLIVRPTPDTL